MTTIQNAGLNPKDFRTALDMDMAAKGINERELGVLLGLSQQSISKWRHRGFPPLYRVDDLRAVFGNDSNIGRMDFTQFAKDVARLRVVAPPNVPDPVTPRAQPSMHGGDRQGAGATHSDQVAAIRAWRADQERDMMFSLPGVLRTHLSKTGSVDYYSPKLAVQVLMSARGPLIMPERVSDRALRLLAARATQGNAEQRLAVAVVLGDVPVPPGGEMTAQRWSRALKGLEDTLKAVGVDLWVVEKGTEVAQEICRVEGVDCAQQDSGGEEEEE